MIHRRLTTAEAAARLGVKPATLYAYVSRGILSRVRTPAGSTFDPQEVARLARSARPPSGEHSPAGGPRRGDDAGDRGRRRGPGRNQAGDPIFVTELTLIDSGRLYYRGLDAVELSRSRTFEAVAEWLWTGRWPTDEVAWSAPPAAATAAASVLRSVGTASLPVEKFMVAVAAAALTDQLRHDLSPAAVPIAGRGLLATLAESLPEVAPARSTRRRDPSRRAHRGPGPAGDPGRVLARGGSGPIDPAAGSLYQRAVVAPAQPGADHAGTEGGAGSGAGALSRSRAGALNSGGSGGGGIPS
jgi:citrate synthase